MYALLKRSLDITLSFIALVCVSPIMVIISIMLLFTGEHIVFYFQQRIGCKGKPFQMIKFATMVKNSPNIGTGLLTTRNDPRVLPFGRFLRITKINELPQLINILKGDMSIVGPRPMVIDTFLAYPKEIRNRVYDARPGLTGIGSIIFRDEEYYVSKVCNPIAFYEEVIYPYKRELEMWYCRHKSLYTDAVLIFLTVWVIIAPKSQWTFRLFKNLPRNDLRKSVESFNLKHLHSNTLA